ncbi:WD repeat and coiled-coil-containing protein-like [Pelobates fuscus]|uniref:WD repeat and coiled-coil-containing protein-like n=1 Tax=Pelobates fuscus TaxID=191477 RepID=UPI002FE47EA1
MDLGKAKLSKTGLNTLFQAIHPLHGLAWTDGRQVVLTALHLDNEEPQFGNSVVIGQFEHVHGLYWGPAIGSDIPALLAIQHKKHVSIWKLNNDPSGKNKLVLSQTCEAADPLPVLPSGCVWHPSKDVLVILTKRDLSVLHSVTCNSDSVKADIKGCGVIHCACWTKDGGCVVAAIDSALHSYTWNDDLKILNPCYFCPVFEINGTINAIQPIMDNQVVVTTGISTDNLHCWNKYTPPDSSALLSSLLVLHEEVSQNNRRISIDSGRSEPNDLIKTSSLLPADLSQILARHRNSDPSHLFQFRHKYFSAEARHSIPSLIIVCFEKNSTTTRKISIPGISTPDILVVDSQAKRVIVASNTSNLILVYPINPSNMSGIQELKLGEKERAKGICFLTDSTLLVLVGRQKTNDVTFLPLSSYEKYMVHLITKKIMTTESNLSVLKGGQNIMLDCISSFCTPENKPFCDHNNSFSKELLMPNSIGVQALHEPKKEAEIISCEHSPSLDLEDRQNIDIESSTHITSTLHPNSRKLCRMFSQDLDGHQKPSNPTEHHPSTSNIGELVSFRQNLGNKESIFTDSHFCLSEGKELLNNQTQLLPYPYCEDPEYVSVVCTNSSGDGTDEKRCILLCHGKLQLRTLHHCFHLTNMEMKCGSRWITLTEDGEGFVPLIFRSKQEVIIRDASLKS